MAKVIIFTNCLREIQEPKFLKIMIQMCFLKNKNEEANDFCMNMLNQRSDWIA